MDRLVLVAVVLALLGTACAPAAAPASAPAAASKPASASPSSAVPAAQPAAAPAPAAPSKRLTVAVSAVSAMVAPVWIALEEGLYRKHGLEVEFANFDGGTRAVTPILTGDTPIGVVTAGAAIDARLQNTDVTMIATLFDTFFFQIYSRPTVRQPADMRGRTMAASSAKSASERAAIAALDPFGLQPGRDYNLTYVGSQSGRLAALEQGLVDATVISPPYGLQARNAGFVELVDLLNLGIPYGHFVVASTERWLRDNPDTARAFLRAYTEGIALVKRDPAVAKRVIAKYTQVDDAALLEESYLVGPPLIPDVPWMREEVVRGSMDTTDNPQARTAAPSQFYDNRLLQELEAEGYFRQLQAR